ncbi:MAG: pantoate--beta-alanine ligase [Deltaproteobacteria bacterium]|nr:pantoate--beta-alanine ligase [Deltaproteobacteria bacterium]
MEVVERIEEMTEISKRARLRVGTWGGGGKSVILIPTMGALHEGHAALIEKARSLAGASRQVIVLSVFVNPKQFGVNEDLADYPRTLEADKRIAKAAGVDIFFNPKAEDVYPEGFATKVDIDDSLSKRLCGRTRHGHFTGVATIVTKLFNIIRPDKAVFGLKDYQQLLIIRRINEDLNLEVDIVGVETLRDPDGLAISSRNTYLSDKERRAALVIPKVLDMAVQMFKESGGGGTLKAEAMKEKLLKTIEKEPLVVVEYIELSAPLTLAPVESVVSGTLLAIAVRVGKTRLIDNRILTC